MRIRTIPYAATMAAAAIGATLLLGGSAAADPDDRGPVPPDGTITVCSTDGVEISSPMTTQDGVEPAQRSSLGEPEVRCDVVATQPTETCRVGAPTGPAEPGPDVAVPTLPAEPGTRVMERGFTCKGAGGVQSGAPR